ncbi:hypothetical protein P9112_008735 [Eukaryota sp. TZLM1-RC]
MLVDLLFTMFLVSIITIGSSQDVSLVSPNHSSQTFYWSCETTWGDTMPVSTSTVFANGKGKNPILVVDENPSFHSLHLSGLTLRLKVTEILINGLLTLDNVHLESTTDKPPILMIHSLYLTTFADFVSIVATITDSGRISGQLHLTNSQLRVEKDAVITIDHPPIFKPLAWGDGSDGKTGTGFTENHGVLEVATEEKFVSISGSAYHTLGITSEGTLFAWGKNNYGQLGLDDTISRNLPTQVALDNIVQVSAGYRFSLARDRDNFVYAWGSNQHGRLGLGYDDDKGITFIDLPEKIENLVNVIDISTSSSHSLAVLDNGEVMAWGRGHQGQLGEDNIVNRNAPVNVLVSPNTVKVKAGRFFSFFLTSEGYLLSTGWNSLGQLCLGDSDNRLIPEFISNYDSFMVSQVSVGDEFTIFLTSEGVVYSCGRVVGRSTAFYSPLFPGIVQGLGRIRSIACGHDVGFAVDFNNVLFEFTLDQEEASPNTETEDWEVGRVFTGRYQFFLSQAEFSSVSGDEFSKIENFGLIENISGYTFNIDLPLSIHSSGAIYSDHGGLEFDKETILSGTIETISEFMVWIQGNLLMQSGCLITESLALNLGYSAISGDGTIRSNLENFGTINPTAEIQVTKNLILRETSRLEFNNQIGNTALLNIQETLNLKGYLDVNFSFQRLESFDSFQLLVFNSADGDFDQVTINCQSFFDYEFGSNGFTIFAINEIIPDLNQISFISPSGTNEDCCGTASVPCLSLSKIIERMGYYGVVYFEEGEYNEINFDVGLIGVDFEFRKASNFEANLVVSTEISCFNSSLLFENMNLNISFINHFIFGTISNITLKFVSVSFNNIFGSLITLKNSSFHLLNSSPIGSSTFLTSTSSKVEISDMVFYNFPTKSFNFENSTVIFDAVKFSETKNSPLDSNSLIYALRTKLTFSKFIVHNAEICLIEADKSDVYFVNIVFINSTASPFVHITDSIVEFTNINVTELLGQFISADNSYLIFNNSNFDTVSSVLPLISVVSSDLFSIDFYINNAELSALIESQCSSLEFLNANLEQIQLIEGNLFSTNSSFASFQNLSMQGNVFNSIPNVFICSNLNTILNFLNSSIEIHNSTLSGCLIDQVFSFDVFFQDSIIFFSKISHHLTFTDLNLEHSTLYLDTNYSTLINSLKIDSKSLILGNGKYLNLDFVFDRLDIIQECISTQSFLIDFEFLFAELIEEFIIIEPFHSEFISLSWWSNFSLLILENNFPISPSSSFIDITFSIPLINVNQIYSQQLCPPQISFPSSSTKGGFFSVNGTNLGHKPLFVSSTTIDLIVQSGPFKHDRFELLIPPGSGCHEVKVKRSLDNILTFWTFCYQAPFIESVMPNRFQLHDFIYINGSNFFINETLLDLSFGNSVIDFVVSVINHDQILLKISNLCNPTIGQVPLFIVISNQPSNVYFLDFEFTDYELLPSILFPLDHELSINLEMELDLTSLSSCNDMEIAGNTPLNWTISPPTQLELTFSLIGIDIFQFIIHLSSDYFKLVEILVIDFAVDSLEYACLTNQICLMSISVNHDTIDVSKYKPVSGSSGLVVLDYLYTDNNCVNVSVVFKDLNSNNDLSLCTNNYCNSFIHLPKILDFDSLLPNQVQFEYKHTEASLTLTGENFDQFDDEFWAKSFKFSSNHFKFSDIKANSLTITTFFDKVGNETLQYIGFGQAIDIFSVVCDDFLEIPPVHFNNSQVVLFSRYTYSSLSLFVNNQIFSVFPGQNSMFLTTQALYIMYNNHIKSQLIKLDHIDEILLVNSLYQFQIDLLHQDLEVDLSTSNHCLISFSVQGSQLIFTVIGTVVEICVVEFQVDHQQSFVKKNVKFFIVDQPMVKILERNYFSSLENITFTILLRFDLACIDTHYFHIQNALVDSNRTSLVKYDGFCFQEFLIYLPYHGLNLSEPIFNIALFWNSTLFYPQLVTELQIFNVDLFSNSTLSVFEPRDIIVSVNVQFNDSITFLIDNQAFEVGIHGFDLILSNFVMNSYKESEILSVLFIDIEIGNVELTMEPFFVDQCFVQPRVSLLSSSDVLTSFYDNSVIFNRFRCCFIPNNDCYLPLESGEYHIIKLSGEYYLKSISITTNSTCEKLLATSPIEVVDIPPTRNFDCESLLNGFDDALFCTIELNMDGFSEIILLALEDVLLFEVEVYGYKVNKCLIIVDNFIGQTVVSDIVNITGYFQLNGHIFTEFESLYLVIQSQLNNSLVTSPFVVNYSFISSSCYYVETPLSKVISPMEPAFVHLINHTVIAKDNSFTLDFHCFDSNDFFVNCFSNTSFAIEFCSFDWKFIEPFSSNAIFFVETFFEPGVQYFTLRLNNISVNIDFVLLQEEKNFLMVSVQSYIQCQRLNLFYSSCTLLHTVPNLIRQYHRFNETLPLNLNNLNVISSANKVQITVFNSTHLEIVFLPLTNIEVYFQFNSLSASVLFTTNDCDSTRMNLNNECHCKPGTVLGSVGECEPCQLGYYLDDPLVGECINCPIGKITKSIGSSNSTECVCLKSQFDDGKGCIKCPKFSICEYGELATVSNGYKFTLETGSISCPYRYSCRNNQCRFNTKGIDCTECIEGTKRYGFVCIGTGFPLILQIVTFIFLICCLFFSEFLLRKSQSKYKKVYNVHLLPSLESSVATAIARSKGQVVCPLRIVMILSILLNQNVLLVTVPFSITASLFGLRFGFSLSILTFLLFFSFCRTLLKHQFSFSNSYYVHFCLILSYLGLVSKHFYSFFDVDLFLLIGVFTSCFILIIKEQPMYDLARSAILLIVFLQLTLLRISFTIQLSIQTVFFLTLVSFSAVQNTIISLIGVFLSTTFILNHVFSSTFLDFFD